MIWGAAVIHLVMAETKGYDAVKWWYTHEDEVYNQSDNIVLDVIFGIIIWPVRLAQFMNVINDYYEMYDLKDSF